MKIVGRAFQLDLTHSPVLGWSSYTPTITPASVAAAVVAEQTFTVTGLAATDLIDAISFVAPSNSAYPIAWRVSAANTLAITYVNPTAGALVPAAGTCTFQVLSN